MLDGNDLSATYNYSNMITIDLFQNY